MNSSLRCYLARTLTVAATFAGALASAAPAAPPAAQQPLAFDHLLQEVAAQTVFVQTTASPHCPSEIAIDEVTEHGGIEQPGDRRFYLRATPTPKGYEYFTHENNSLTYRPGLAKGGKQTLNRSLDFPLGVAYTVSGQQEKSESLTYYRAVVIAAVPMIASVKASIKYEASLRTITYHFEGNGVADVDCVFKAK